MTKHRTIANWRGLVLIVICAGSAAPASTVRIGTFLTAIDYAPFYVAKSNACLAQLGRDLAIDYSYEVFKSIPAINAAVASGRLDVILEADSPAILQRAAGADIREITPLAALSQELVVPARSPVANLAGLRGARVGVLFGSGYHFAIVDAMATAGIEATAYSTVDTAPDAGSAAFAEDRIDAWAIWPPILQRMVEGGRFRAIPGSASTLNVYAWGAGPFMHANPAFVAGFVPCVRQAIAYARSHKPETVRIVARETGIAPATVEQSWSTMTFGFGADDEVFRVLNAQARFLRGNGYIQQDVTFEPAAFYDRGF